MQRVALLQTTNMFVDPEGNALCAVLYAAHTLAFQNIRSDKIIKKLNRSCHASLTNTIWDSETQGVVQSVLQE